MTKVELQSVAYLLDGAFMLKGMFRAVHILVQLFSFFYYNNFHKIERQVVIAKRLEHHIVSGPHAVAESMKHHLQYLPLDILQRFRFDTSEHHDG